MTTRDDVKELVDRLPAKELPHAKRYLEYLAFASDPLVRKFLSAPIEDEELNEDAVAELEQAKKEMNAGHSYSHVDVKKALGL